MQWSPEQDSALKTVSRWIESGDGQVFRLFGYAGTGKTTLARHLAEHIDGEVAFGAFTGSLSVWADPFAAIFPSGEFHVWMLGGRAVHRFPSSRVR